MPFDRRQFLLGALALGAAACSSTGSSGDASPAAATDTSVPPTAVPPTAVPPTTAAPTTVAPTTTRFSGTARYIPSGDTSARRVALTFHTEGTVAQVTRLLDMAKALEVPLTMLIVGKWLESNRALGTRIVDAGHDIGNHTYSHLSLPDQTRTVVAQEIERCAALLRDITGNAGRWFRPSGSNSTTALINEEAGRAGYPIVLGFDTDPLDYQDPGSATVRSRVVAGVKPGGIVSLHAQHQGTIDVFESMVGAVRDKGFSFARASDLVR